MTKKKAASGISITPSGEMLPGNTYTATLNGHDDFDDNLWIAVTTPAGSFTQLLGPHRPAQGSFLAPTRGGYTVAFNDGDKDLAVAVFSI